MEESIALNNNQSHEIAKEIRRNFRTLMNGPLSQSMREKGVEYNINWGATLTHLQEFAKDYNKNMQVAIDLWKDKVRESKLLALMLMPIGDFSPDIAGLWSEHLLTQEIAEMAAMLLYQHLDYAPQIAMKLIADGDELQQILGISILSRLFMQKRLPDERGRNEIEDQLNAILLSKNISLRHAAFNCLNKLNDTINHEY